MDNRHTRPMLGLTLALGLTLVTGGCNWSRSSADETQQQRDDRTRDEVARATQEIKPKLEVAGRELNEAAEKAGEQIRAAAQGVKDGLAKEPSGAVDVNTASAKELTEVPGITDRDARRIIRGRPYAEKHELVKRGILSESSYSKVEDQLTAK